MVLSRTSVHPSRNLVDICLTAFAALWVRDEYFRFWGLKVEDRGHGEIKCARKNTLGAEAFSTRLFMPSFGLKRHCSSLLEYTSMCCFTSISNDIVTIHTACLSQTVLVCDVRPFVFAACPVWAPGTV